MTSVFSFKISQQSFHLLLSPEEAELEVYEAELLRNVGADNKCSHWNKTKMDQHFFSNTVIDDHLLCMGQNINSFLLFGIIVKKEVDCVDVGAMTATAG